MTVKTKNLGERTPVAFPWHNVTIAHCGISVVQERYPLTEELLLSYRFTYCLLPSKIDRSKIDRIGNRVVKENWSRKHLLLHAQVRSVPLCVARLFGSLHSHVVGMMRCSAKVLVKDGTTVGALV